MASTFERSGVEMGPVLVLGTAVAPGGAVEPVRTDDRVPVRPAQT